LTADHIRAAFHEVDAFLWFDEWDLSPYWSLAELCIERFDGYGEVSVDVDGEPWVFSLGYSKSGIAPRPEDAVGGDSLYEWELHADGPGEKKAHYNVSPRFPEMRKAADPSESVSVPWCGGEGVDVHVEGSNLSFDEYTRMLRRAVTELAAAAGTTVNDDYFADPRDESKIATVELYVRLYREYAEKLVRPDGPFYSLMHLLATQEGQRWTFSGDNTDIIGKRHAFDVYDDVAADLIPGHQYGSRLKCYHPKHVRTSETSDDPLSSPKFGAAFHKSLDDGAVAWADRDELTRELEERLVNILRWAGIPTTPDPTAFRDDPHFDVVASDRDVGRFDDPTPELEAQQEALIMRVLDDLSPSAKAVTERVATDCGVRYDQLADATGYSISQVYRAIDRLGDLVENQNGLVKLTSEKIRQDVQAMVERLETEIATTADQLAHLCDVETRSAADSSLQLWMAKYGIQFRDVADDMEGTVRIDTMLSRLKSATKPRLENVLEAGLEAWARAGRDPQQFAALRYEADVDGTRETGLIRPVVAPH
jgi:hypothetical protein